jgi:simple sugar transport system permease protein
VQLGPLPWAALPAAVLAAVATGFVWGWIPGYMKARWQANEIVTTLMLNVVAIQLYRLVITHAFNDPSAGFLAAPALPGAAVSAPWLALTSVTAFVLIAPLAVALAWFILNRTTLGYEIRAVGDSPAFAARSGMPVRRTVALSMALGGAFAGLAGLHLSNALFKRLPVELSPGIGFEGLVVALLARNDPKAVLPAAFLYAYLKAGGQAMERATDVSREVVLVIQALIIMCVVCERFVPAALARWSWRKGQGAGA